MRPGLLHFWCYWIVRVLRWIAFTAMVMVLLIPVISDGGNRSLADFKKLVFDNTKLINTTILGALAVLSAARKLIGEPWMWDCVGGILRGFQRDIFQDVGGGELADHHRVTLYRYQKCCWFPTGRGTWLWPWGNERWPCSGWLVPVVRAGPDTAGTTVFPAGEKFEGVCGAAYSQQSGTLEIKACTLPNITDSSSQTDIEAYAKGTFVPVEMIKDRIKRGRPCARYFLALRVYVQSQKWGVIMIDSRAESPDQPNIAAHRFSQIKDVLDHLLRRA